MLHQQATISAKQQGATLIMVLIILVAVSVLGITAMKMGLTGLTLATNSQISNLLFQAADKGMLDMETAIKGPTGDASTAMAVGGIVGLGGDTAHCVAARAGPDVKSGFTTGACQTTATDNYLSSRQINMVQVNNIRSSFGGLDGNAITTGLQMGTGKTGLAAEKLVVTSTSVMVGVGAAEATTINNCMLRPSDDAQDAAVTTITDCLTDSGAIFTTHQDEYSLGYSF